MIKIAINKEWHLKNKMPKNASFDERVKWYTEHNKNCSCHPGFPKKLEEEMKKSKIKYTKLFEMRKGIKIFIFIFLIEIIFLIGTLFLSGTCTYSTPCSVPSFFNPLSIQSGVCAQMLALAPCNLSSIYLVS